MRFSIKHKFLIIFSILIFLMTVIGYQSLHYSRAINNRLQEIYTKDVVENQEVGKLELAISNIRGEILEYFLSDDAGQKEHQREKISAQINSIDNQLRRLATTQSASNQTRFLHEIQKNWQETSHTIKKVLLHINTLPKQEVENYLNTTVFPSLANLRNQLDVFSHNNLQEAQRRIQEAQKAYNKSKTITFVSIGIALLLSVFLSVLLSSNITRSARRMASTARIIAKDELPQLSTGIEHLANGNLTSSIDITIEPITVKQKDEMGELGQAFNEIIEELQQASQSFQRTMTQMKAIIEKLVENTRLLNVSSEHLSISSTQSTQAIEQVSIAIHQVAQGTSIQNSAIFEANREIEHITQAMEEIAQGAQDQAASIERVAASITQMASQIQEVSRSVQVSAELSRHTEESARAGADTIDKAIQLMVNIKDSVENVASRVDNMLMYTQKVNTILETIEGIADQTNLLSINAAIEAAQAGVHGKGFAVVAEEVRKLAERSSEATRQIGQLIANIQKGTQETKTTMDDSVLQAEKGAREAANAREALNRILKSIGEVSSKVDQIAAATSEMAIASNDVEQAMNSVSATVEESSQVLTTIAQSSKKLKANMDEITRVSQENSAAAEEVSAMTEEMSAQIVEINNSVRDMKQVAEHIYSITSRFNTGITQESKGQPITVKSASQPHLFPNPHPVSYN